MNKIYLKSAIRINLRKLSETCDEERSVHAWDPSSRKHVRGATKGLFQDYRHIPASLPSKFCNDPLHPEWHITHTNCKKIELYNILLTNHSDLLPLTVSLANPWKLTR